MSTPSDLPGRASSPPAQQQQQATTTTYHHPTTTTTTNTTISPSTSAAATTTTTTQTPARRARPGLYANDSGSWRNPSTIRIRREPSSLLVPGAAPGGRSGSVGYPLNQQQQRLRAVSSVDFADRPNSGSAGGSNLRNEARPLEPVVEGNRRRSSSDPNRSWNQTHDSNTGAPIFRDTFAPLPGLAEGVADTGSADNLAVPGQDAASKKSVGRRFSAASLMRFPSFRPGTAENEKSVEPESEPANDQSQYNADLIDLLDTLDPEVSTLNTLNNVQNSLFVPNLGKYLNRRPTYTLTKYPTRGTVGTAPDLPVPTEQPELEGDDDITAAPPINRMTTLTSITSKLDEDHFAVLPHGERLKGWSKTERDELNDHVRHLLHSRKEKFKRSMKGFGQYVRKPLGFLVTLYATLITLFGLAWVLFLIGWINVGGKRDYIVNIIDNVLVALFAIMGDGLAPFRAVDTYHMCFIAHYHHLTWRLRRERALPKLDNKNDLPALTVNEDNIDHLPDLEAEEKLGEMSVLNPNQQKKLVHHQKKFSRSHTFYKPHETETHFAFPLRILVAVVCLLDCHSLFQIALGTCTWAISYKTRPFALTTVILCCSITCNITAGILISIGDHKSRKKDVLERMHRQELTAQAIHTLEKRREHERKIDEEMEMEQIAESPDEGPTPPPKEERYTSPLGSPTSPSSRPGNAVPRSITMAGA